jgi:2-(1,2-epoxy-1,2-dihydrophenyl)acetyl-CoA isomerase
MEIEMAAVLVDCQDGVATLTFNRPEVRNAIDQDSVAIIEGTLSKLELSSDVRVLVLKGAGGNFVSGGDVNFFRRSFDWRPEERRIRFAEVVRRIHPVIATLRRMRQPVIASVNGSCAGWGVSLTLASDLAIAADDARFSLAYTSIGACIEGSGSFFLPRVVGFKRAMELALLSNRFDAVEALQYGIVNRVVPSSELSAATDELAHRLATGPAMAYAATKRLMNDSLTNSLEAQMEAEALAFGNCAATQDFAEGAQALWDGPSPPLGARMTLPSTGGDGP